MLEGIGVAGLPAALARDGHDKKPLKAGTHKFIVKKSWAFHLCPRNRTGFFNYPCLLWMTWVITVLPAIVQNKTCQVFNLMHGTLFFYSDQVSGLVSHQRHDERLQ